MALEAVRTLLAEPAIADPPRRTVRDVPVAIAAVLGGTLEFVLRDDVVWPVPSLVMLYLTVPLFMVRRRRPLLATAALFSGFSAMAIASVVADAGATGLYTIAYTLVIPYALFRWGSGADMARGTPFLAAGFVTGIIADPGTVGDAIGGLIALACPEVLGLVVRQRSQARRRSVERVQLEERQSLARELHDTVAHHVSAIAIQAQAGQAVAARRPEDAVEALRIIESEASRTLAEMRSIVGALRRTDGSADGSHDVATADDHERRRPHRGISDLDQFVGVARAGPRVEIVIDPALDNVPIPTPVDSAVYRIAQESITNATRHADGATVVTVEVGLVDDGVRLTVVDDGRTDLRSPRAEPEGYGIVGMTERATLLGGSLTAGLAPSRSGWLVDARLPLDRRLVADALSRSVPTPASTDRSGATP